MIKLTKNKQELLNRLGEGYIAKEVHMEPIIYRDFGDFDVEILGAHKEGLSANIVFWHKRIGFHVVERVEIEDGNFECIENELARLIQKYVKKRNQ